MYGYCVDVTNLSNKVVPTKGSGEDIGHRLGTDSVRMRLMYVGGRRFHVAYDGHAMADSGPCGVVDRIYRGVVHGSVMILGVADDGGMRTLTPSEIATLEDMTWFLYDRDGDVLRPCVVSD